MHLDLVYALISGLLVFAVLEALYRFGIVERGRKRFDWKAFAAIFAALFILSVLWPH